jgi:hypothetical protein
MIFPLSYLLRIKIIILSSGLALNCKLTEDNTPILYGTLKSYTNLLQNVWPQCMFITKCCHGNYCVEGNADVEGECLASFFIVKLLY